MAFAPTSIVMLCNVPFDSTYRNQIHFKSEEEQARYFIDHQTKAYNEYLYVRKNLPTGGIQSSIKVGANIDTLYNCNYMMYMNPYNRTRWCYAFITKLIYVNDNTTEIVFETDVWQTYCFDVNIMESFVVREHSEEDEIGGNIIPEPFECNDYVYEYMQDITPPGGWGYLVALSNPSDESKTGERGKPISGIYQGLYYYYFSHENAHTQLPVFLNSLDEDSVQFIATIPFFCIPNEIGPTETNPNVSPYYVQASDEPFKLEKKCIFDFKNHTFEGYVPRNNKLYTSPYINLVATDHAGQVACYAVEDLSPIPVGDYEREFTLAIYGDISGVPSIYMYPRNYKGLPHALEYGMSMESFPQCSYANDAYKLWMAKTQYAREVNYGTQALNTVIGAGGIVLGAGMMSNPVSATTGANAVLSGANSVVNSISGILQTWASEKAAEHEANRTISGSAKSNLLTAMGWNCISLYKRTIKYDHAKCIDDFFTMFGYQTNKVKLPNISSRNHFNYVQTNGVNIVCKTNRAVPNDDMMRLKRIFDEGVTFWKPTATVGDYSVDNSAGNG